MKKASIHVFAVMMFLPLFTDSSFAARIHAPKVTTNAATSVTATSATLNGGVNPNGETTTAWFEWGTDPTLATFGATPNQFPSSNKGSNAISVTLSGLTSGMTYYFRVVASNSAGTSKGSIANFSTSSAAVAPTVVTYAASSVTTTGGVLNGGVNPNGLATYGWFEWGTSPTLATFSSTSSQSLGSGTTSQGVAEALSGLTSGTTYYFRMVASNSAGASKGSIASFSTVLGGSGGGVIPQANWRLWYVDSEETVGENGVVENAFDGNSDTYWHTEWFMSDPPHPHEIQIDLGGNYTIGGFRYLPRHDSENGGIANYAFYVSADGTNWETAVATGTFPKTATEKEVLFSGKPGRFIRLRALSEVNGNPWTSIAELNVLEGDIASVDQYVAIGDSITAGDYDDISSDGKGYEPVLQNLLSDARGYPVEIVNAGVGGVNSAYGAANISTTLSAYPQAKYYLILYGTNDAFIPAVPSGLGLAPGNDGYDGSYKDNMQQIISSIVAAGKLPYLAKVPYTTRSSQSLPSIGEYNQVIDELVAANGISVIPPDFYGYFLAHQGELIDGLHPSGVGYQSMANLWFSALTK